MVASLKRIFDLDKVTFDNPGESNEQNCMFIQVEKADVRIRDGRQISKSMGTLRVFANADKLPYGFFAKKIAEASPVDTERFFFGAEENLGTFQNIAERRFSFVFLLDSQYDPALGTISEVNISITETA